MKRYLLNLATWIDIGVNVTLLAGSPYETISSRVQRQVEKDRKWAVKFAAPFINWLFQDPNHCKDARIPDELIINGPNWWKL